MSHAFTARIDVALFGQCLSCLLGPSASAKSTSAVTMIVTPLTMSFYAADPVYGSCFTLDQDVFDLYDYIQASGSSAKREIQLEVDRFDLAHCADYAQKIGAQKIRIECSNEKLVMYSSAPNGHSIEQGFLLLSSDERHRRRLMPINESTSSLIGEVHTVYALQLKNQLELFKHATEVKMAFQSQKQDKVGLILSAEDSKYVVRFSLREGESDISHFFSGYDVATPIVYRLNAASIARLHQILRACHKFVRLIRVLLYSDALLWQFDVGGGSSSHVVLPIFVRHDIPQMSALGSGGG